MSRYIATRAIRVGEYPGHRSRNYAGKGNFRERSRYSSGFSEYCLLSANNLWHDRFSSGRPWVS